MRSLVAYGTRYGSTGEVADAIAQILRSAGSEVDVMELTKKTRPEVRAYDLVVIGTNIIMGSWNKQVKRFVQENLDDLGTRKSALFVCCGDLLDPSKEEEAYEKYITAPLAEMGMVPDRVALLGGVIDLSRYGMMVKTLMKNVMRSSQGEDFDTEKVYDLRDWEAVERFASGLVPS